MQDYTDLPAARQAKEQAIRRAENSSERVGCAIGCPAVQRSAHDVADVRHSKSKQ